MALGKIMLCLTVSTYIFYRLVLFKVQLQFTLSLLGSCEGDSFLSLNLSLLPFHDFAPLNFYTSSIEKIHTVFTCFGVIFVN